MSASCEAMAEIARDGHDAVAQAAVLEPVQASAAAEPMQASAGEPMQTGEGLDGAEDGGPDGEIQLSDELYHATNGAKQSFSVSGALRSIQRSRLRMRGIDSHLGRRSGQRHGHRGGTSRGGRGQREGCGKRVKQRRPLELVGK